MPYDKNGRYILPNRFSTNDQMNRSDAERRKKLQDDLLASREQEPQQSMFDERDLGEYYNPTPTKPVNSDLEPQPSTVDNRDLEDYYSKAPEQEAPILPEQELFQNRQTAKNTPEVSTEKKKPISLTELDPDADLKDEIDRARIDPTERALSGASRISSIMQEVMAKRGASISGKDPTQEIAQIQKGQERLEANLNGRESLRLQLMDKLEKRKSERAKVEQDRQDKADRLAAPDIRSEKLYRPDGSSYIGTFNTKDLNKGVTAVPGSESAPKDEKIGTLDKPANIESVKNLNSALVKAGKQPLPTDGSVTNADYDRGLGILRGDKEEALDTPDQTATSVLAGNLEIHLNDPNIPENTKKAYQKILERIASGEILSRKEVSNVQKLLPSTTSSVGATRLSGSDVKDLSSTSTSLIEAGRLTEGLQNAEKVIGKNLLTEMTLANVQEKAQALAGTPLSEQAKAALKLSAQINQFTARIRNQLFGATLTDNEQASAARFLPGDKDSLDGAMIKVQDTINHLRDIAKGKVGVLQSQNKKIPQDLLDFVNTGKVPSQPTGSVNTPSAQPTGGKQVVKKQYSKSANKTKLIYADGTEEIVDGQR